MAEIRIGITGSGFMGKTHAQAVSQLKDARLVGIAGGSRALHLAESFGVICATNSEALTSRSDIDAIIVSTPHFVHVHEVLLAIESGKHVLVEKPMATSVEDCKKMVEAAAARNVVLSVGYQQRFRKNNREARQVIQSGAIGDVITIQVSMPINITHMQSDSGFGGNWAWWRNPASVGHLLNSAPHAIDLLRWMMNSEVDRVSAFSRTFRQNWPVEDTTMALMNFTNGAICSLYSSCALPADPFPGEDFRFRVVGTRGLLDLDPYGELRVEDPKGWRMVSKQPPVGYQDSDSAFSPVRMQAYQDQLSAFFKAIRGEPSEGGNGVDGLIGVKVCLAMLEASRRQTVIRLGDDGAAESMSTD